MKMSNIRTLFGWRARKVPAPTFLGALRKVAGEEAFAMAAFESPDRREILSTAARQMHMSESLLLETLARILELPFSRVVEAPASLPEGVSLLEFRVGGCVPIYERGLLIGLCCVDPSFVAPIRRILGPLPITLARWSDIRVALGEFESREKEKAARHANEHQEACRKLALRALSAMVRQADSHRQASLQINDEQELLQYEFQTEGGLRARGKVRGEAREALLCFLDAAASEVLLLPEEGGSAIDLRMRVEKTSSTRFVVSWQREAPAAENVVSFPSAPLHDASTVLSNSRRKPGSRRSRVLIVDDNPTFGRVLERFFQRQDLDVEHALDGAKALALLRKDSMHVDLVICDVHMPEVNGHEFLKRLRGDARFALLPVVMLTSDTDIELKLQLLKEGADALLTKNEDPRLLYTHVRRLIEKSNLLKAA
ncbi:MAG: response regulator [Deltaproteobacteria bacterium]|nr:response regulator [Deltaproteobacteria bacterium]